MGTKTLNGLRGDVFPERTHGSVLAERAGDAVERMDLYKYFKLVRAHDLLHVDERDAACFYCDVITYRAEYARAVNVVRTEEFVVHDGLYVPDVFFDRQRLLRYIGSSTCANPVDSIELTLRGKSIGHYIPELNVLFATDWTHEVACVDVFEHIWPDVKERLGLRVIDTAQERAKRKVFPKSSITVGCDPEYEAVRSGCVVSAAGLGVPTAGPVGLDGAGYQVELRPAPGTPRQVVRSLRKLMQRFADEYRDAQLGVRGDVYPLGGHVHVGVGREWEPPDALLMLLDDFVGRPTLKLSGRARGAYKCVGTYETKRWGFEYRTPPAAIFVSPEVAHIALKLVRNLVHKFINAKKVVYNAPPTSDDYMRVGGLSAHEADVFLAFVQQYAGADGGHKKLFAAWGVSQTNKKDVVRITLRDAWNPEVGEYYADALHKALRKLRPKKDVHIVLYGLSGSRGHVATIDIPGTDINKLTQPPLPRVVDGVLHIGLPVVVRGNAPPFDTEEIREKVASALVNEAKEFVKGVM